MRVCTSAGEALPADIGRRWTEHFGVEILDGIGSTEMLHIFLSNRPGEVRYGTTGKAVPGYKLRIVERERRGRRAGRGRRSARVAGPTAAAGYWNNRERTRSTFIGEWTRTGDKYTLDKDGYYTYGGRSDDMLKVGGIYVSPFEVEAALLTHPDVLEAAVIGVPDDQELDQAEGLRGDEAGRPGDAGARGDAEAAREGPPRALQVPALGRVRRRAAEDRDREDPALQAPGTRRFARVAASTRDALAGTADMRAGELIWTKVDQFAQELVNLSKIVGYSNRRSTLGPGLEAVNASHH